MASTPSSSPSTPSDFGPDTSPSIAGYATTDRLVTGSWLGARLGSKGLVVIECNDNPLLYDIGHIPTAIRLRHDTDLHSHEMRDVLSAEAFAALMNANGISRSDTVVFYGDQSNMWAAYGLWVFTLFGHPDVRLLDGGRDAWMQEERETSYAVPTRTSSGYPVVERDDETHRIFVDAVRHLSPDRQIIDLRSSTAHADAHIPGAVNIVPEQASVWHNSRFRPIADLEQAHAHLEPARETVVYCDNGPKAAHEWFTLTYLLGWDTVRVYDGSWEEWSHMVRMPIASGNAGK